MADGLFGDQLNALLKSDPRFEPVLREVGTLPERRGSPGFSGLANIVVSQLVSRQSADAIWTRLLHATGPLTPRSYLVAGAGVGPRLGLTAAKADTLVAVAEAIERKQLDLDALQDLPAEQAIACLTAIKGIGFWTAEVHLLFNCAHPDIFPAGDLALRAAAAAVFSLPERPSVEALRQMAEHWSPRRSVAARLLWAYYGKVVRPGPPILP